MGLNIQIAVDCADPHTLADWWAETLGWSVEPTDPAFIRSMVAQGYATEAETKEHNGNLVWRTGAAICPTDQVGVTPRLRMLFQEVPEPKVGKNRIHWDINLEPEDGDKDAMRTALEARGATFLYEASQGPHSWFTMTDPEGNEFCFG